MFGVIWFFVSICSIYKKDKKNEKKKKWHSRKWKLAKITRVTGKMLPRGVRFSRLVKRMKNCFDFFDKLFISGAIALKNCCLNRKNVTIIFNCISETISLKLRVRNSLKNLFISQFLVKKLSLIKKSDQYFALIKKCWLITTHIAQRFHTKLILALLGRLCQNQPIFASCARKC